jgi:hypothetical protein
MCLTVCSVPIGKVLFVFDFILYGVFSVVWILSPIKHKLLKALNIYLSAKLGLFHKIFTQYLFILYLIKTYTSLALLDKVYTFYIMKKGKNVKKFNQKDAVNYLKRL